MPDDTCLIMAACVTNTAAHCLLICINLNRILQATSVSMTDKSCLCGKPGKSLHSVFVFNPRQSVTVCFVVHSVCTEIRREHCRVDECLRNHHLVYIERTILT